MVRVRIICIVAILLIGSGAAVAQDQGQTTAAGLIGVIDLMHGHQTAATNQNLCIDNKQNVRDQVKERFLGNFIQVGEACGECALIGVTLQVQAAGDQTQSVGPCVDARTEGQTLSLGAVQLLSRGSGPGGGSGQHVAILQEEQQAANAGGIMSEKSNVAAIQNSNLGGSAGATSATQTQASVGVVQQQFSL